MVNGKISLFIPFLIFIQKTLFLLLFYFYFDVLLKLLIIGNKVDCSLVRSVRHTSGVGCSQHLLCYTGNPQILNAEIFIRGVSCSCPQKIVITYLWN